MPVDAPQHHPLAVQVQATGHELDRAEAEPDRLFVQHPVGQAAGAGTDELYGKSVQGGVLNAPRMHPVQGAGDGQGKFPHGRQPRLPAGLRISACRVQPTVSPTVAV